MALKLKRGNKNEIKLSKQYQLPIYASLIKLRIVKSMAKSYEQKLLISGSSEDPQLFAAKIFFYLLLSSILTVILMGFGLFILVKFYLPFHLTKYLALSFMMIIFGIIIPPVTYLANVATISQKIESRRIGVDAELSAFTSVFSIFLRSGLTPRLMFDKLSSSTAFHYINGVTLYVSKRIRYLGESVEDAMYHASQISPSKLLKDFFLAYITAVRTGAPVINTIEAKAKDILDQLQLRAALAADRLSGLAESYVIWLSSGYIMFFLMMVLEAIFPVGGTSMIPVLGAVAVILLPLVNIVFIYGVEQTQLRFPEKKLNYNLFLIFLGIGLAVMFVLLILEKQLFYFFTLSGETANITPTVIDITIGLLIASIPPAVILTKDLKAGTGYDPYVVSFMRAVAEGLRAGLPPETIIKNIKDSKEMGKFGKILNEIYAYITLGYPLKDAFRKGADRIMDFTSKISLVSLADMMEIGSMTPDTVESIARQIESQIKIKRDYESKVKILLVTPYMGVILSLIASVLLGSAILSLLVGQKITYAVGPLIEASVLLPRAIYITAISSLFNSFMAGLLVGKLGTGKIATGLVHSAILVIITAAMLLILLHVHLAFYSPSSTTI
ncbi:type II secretion system F family protein [Acidianus sp. HS-5]|uniref:type II secretion system F family protein n=1 Tax=Acidianus sp. HS-5 TaxID=2886040 RepID=UPI001F37DDDE|nr:type II secretion system F family protein [Acidianus sp. HS-5]BDC18104.1 flagellar assembly protein [Acidianus sp. HS-5]